MRFFITGLLFLVFVSCTANPSSGSGGSSSSTSSHSYIISGYTITKITNYYTNDGLPSDSYGCISVQGTKIMAGTLNSGVVFSSNYGTNWIVMNKAVSGLTNDQVNAVLIDNGTCYIGTFGGLSVYTPADGKITNDLGGVQIRNIASSADTIYLATDKGLYVSPKSSISWTLYNSGTLATNINLYSLAIKDGKLYIGTAARIYISGLDCSSFEYHDVTATSPADPVQTIIKAGNNLIAGVNYAVSVSSNEGTNWTLDEISTGGGAATGFAADSDGDVYLVKYGAELYYSKNSGVDWSYAVFPGAAVWALTLGGLPYKAVQSMSLTAQGFS